jgi:hypothetical protein
MPVHYSSLGGRHQVSVVCCPGIMGNCFAQLSQDSPNSWALRDFIAGRMIRKTPAPNEASSTRLPEEIEEPVTYSEAPPFYAGRHHRDWTVPAPANHGPHVSTAKERSRS